MKCLGVITKAIYLTLIAIPLAMLSGAAGIHIFSDALLSPFGALFFFLVFLNELSLVYL